MPCLRGVKDPMSLGRTRALGLFFDERFISLVLGKHLINTQEEDHMKSAKILTWIGLLLMTVGLVNGFLNGDFFEDGAKLLANPWGVMSMIDLYVGFALFSMWIAYREPNRLHAILWIVLMMVLGFFTGCLYVLIKLYTSERQWDIFFLGKHHALKSRP